jgi:prepilin-type N-terminal cleavage/methylation domain-containing protein
MRKSKGFTLIEILVAVVILAVGVGGIAALQVKNVRTTGFNKDASIATGLAQKKIEDLKNTVFDSIVSNTTGVMDSGMTVTWNVATTGTAPNRYKDVTVTIAWGANRNLSCYTIITEP